MCRRCKRLDWLAVPPANRFFVTVRSGINENNNEECSIVARHDGTLVVFPVICLAW